MNIHEYQAKQLLSRYGAPVPRGAMAATVEEALKAAQALPGPVWVVKAQIHAGGRGKGRLVAESETADMFKKLTSDADNYSGKVKGDRVGGVHPLAQLVCFPFSEDFASTLRLRANAFRRNFWTLRRLRRRNAFCWNGSSWMASSCKRNWRR